MIDPVTGWFKMAEIKTKSADVIANVIELTWLNRYPWPTEVVLDRGREFMAEFSEMIQKDYGLIKKPITTNPTAKDEWANRPSKASPGRFVFFCS